MIVRWSDLSSLTCVSSRQMTSMWWISASGCRMWRFAADNPLMLSCMMHRAGPTTRKPRSALSARFFLALWPRSIRIRSAGGIIGFPQLVYSPRYLRGGRRGRRLPSPPPSIRTAGARCLSFINGTSVCLFLSWQLTRTTWTSCSSVLTEICNGYAFSKSNVNTFVSPSCRLLVLLNVGKTIKNHSWTCTDYFSVFWFIIMCAFNLLHYLLSVQREDATFLESTNQVASCGGLHVFQQLTEQSRKPFTFSAGGCYFLEFFLKNFPAKCRIHPRGWNHPISRYFYFAYEIKTKQDWICES